MYVNMKYFQSMVAMVVTKGHIDYYEKYFASNGCLATVVKGSIGIAM